MYLYIDFETRSKTNLKKRGAHNYFADTSADVLCVAWALNDGDIHVEAVDTLNPAQCAVWAAAWHCSGAILVAHNASFELEILRRFYNCYWPAGRVIDTAYLAACAGLPRGLGAACAALGVKGKDSRGEALIDKLSNPRRRTKNDRSTWESDAELMAQMREYCAADVAALRRLHKEVTKWDTPNSRALWALDRKINERGFRVDADLARAGARMADEIRARADAEIERLTDGAIRSTGQAAAIAAYCGLTDCREETVDAALSTADGKRRRMLELRQQGSRSSLKKYAAALDSACADGVIRGALLINATNTGRWAGRGFQPHNLPRGSVKPTPEIIDAIISGDLAAIELAGDPAEVLSSSVRALIVPSAPGEVLIGCDYAAIEARVLLWLAGERDALELLRDGGDLYIDMAATIYGIRPEEVTKGQRAVGKMVVLGLGYGMGAAKFAERAQAAGMHGAAAMAEQIVNAYRAKFAGVPALWSKTDSELCEGDHVVTLPSGREIIYRGVRCNGGRWSYLSPRGSAQTRTEIWGGTLVENLCQAVACDLLRDALDHIEAVAPVVLHVHDEVVVSVPREKAEKVKTKIENIMSAPPAWANRLPLACEAWIAERFRK